MAENLRLKTNSGMEAVGKCPCDSGWCLSSWQCWDFLRGLRVLVFKMATSGVSSFMQQVSVECLLYAWPHAGCGTSISGLRAVLGKASWLSLVCASWRWELAAADAEMGAPSAPMREPLLLGAPPAAAPLPGAPLPGVVDSSEPFPHGCFTASVLSRNVGAAFIECV